MTFNIRFGRRLLAHNHLVKTSGRTMVAIEGRHEIERVEMEMLAAHRAKVRETRLRSVKKPTARKRKAEELV